MGDGGVDGGDRSGRDPGDGTRTDRALELALRVAAALALAPLVVVLAALTAVASLVGRGVDLARHLAGRGRGRRPPEVAGAEGADLGGRWHIAGRTPAERARGRRWSAGGGSSRLLSRRPARRSRRGPSVR